MRNTHIGIIGGGQLGMLLVQAAIPFPCRVSVYDPNPSCSAAVFSDSFTQGAFDDEESIVEFGRGCDAVIFEIEQVNVGALLELEAAGVRVVSSARSLEWIQNKALQREVLAQHGFPGPHFERLSANDLGNYSGPFPVVQKWETGGYDGKGVQIHADLESLMTAEPRDSLLEENVAIEKELSLLLAANDSGDVVFYSPTEMVFDSQLNLLDYLIAPARISVEIQSEMEVLGRKLVEELKLVGVYAIEFFLTKSGELLVNEISPRVHNSGHHTVSANVCSQYEQQIRIALGLPLGSTQMLHHSLLANLISDQSSGLTNYVGLEAAYALPGVQLTFYGKNEVRPGRKMGHAIIQAGDLNLALEQLQQLRTTLTITSHD